MTGYGTVVAAALEAGTTTDVVRAEAVTVLLIWTVERMMLVEEVVGTTAVDVDGTTVDVDGSTAVDVVGTTVEETEDEVLDAAGSILKWLDHWKVLSSEPSRVIWIP